MEPTSADHRPSPPSAAPFALEVEDVFSAAHAIVIAGERERLHGHDWRVVATVSGERLDDEELLCDFHMLERELKAIVAPFRSGNMNEIPPFDRVNPTAEAVARHLLRELSARLAVLAPQVAVEQVRVTEAPGCVAIARRTTHERGTR